MALKRSMASSNHRATCSTFSPVLAEMGITVEMGLRIRILRMHVSVSKGNPRYVKKIKEVLGL